MRHLLSSLGLLTVTIATSVSAQTADTHTGHQIAGSVPSPAAPSPQPPLPCPMMKDKEAGKQGDGKKAPNDMGCTCEGMDHGKDTHGPNHNAGDGK